MGVGMQKLLVDLAHQRAKNRDLIDEIDASPDVIIRGGRVVLEGEDARAILATLRELCSANLELLSLISKRFAN